MEKYLLMFIAAAALISAFRVITAKNTVQSAFALILTFFTTAILWLSLAAEFLAISLVLVYVGAVLVLFLFVVMMFEEEVTVKETVLKSKYPLLISLVLLALMVSVFTIYKDAQTNSIVVPYEQYNNIKVLAEVLFNEYLLEFEIVGLVLLVGIIAAISLTHNSVMRRKSQSVDQQVQARATDRLRMLKMDGSEKLIEDK